MAIHSCLCHSSNS